ncbi:MAG: TonB-dependent receptor, partial [Oricola sp.]|nr:TonB-dependent receptor [Oricola sp.]
DGQLIRFAYSKSIARPDVGLLRNSVDISVLAQDDPRTPGGDPTPGGSGFFGFTANTGNPFLNPIKSHNFDLSYEWYFADVGSLTFSAFYKIIDDIVIAGAGDVTLTNNGATVDNLYLRQPTNSPETGKIKGFEVAYQQFYDFLPSPFDGVGTQLTYTYIDSTGVPSAGVNATNSAPAGNGDNDPLIDLSDFPLEGLSKHNVNASVIYEKGPISTRLSYNWRSDYLVTARDVITPFYPIFQNSTGQLDGSFFYSINENIKVGVQAANILNEITETESFIPQSDGRRGARSFFENDRRITISLRANLN